MKKLYSDPVTEITEVEGAREVSCAEPSGIDPNNGGGNIYGGSTDSGTHPLD